MTEVPDHLLQRSRERRAALGGGSAAPAAPAGGGGGGDDAGASGGGAVVPAAAAAPAIVEEAAPPRVLPPYVQAALVRKKMPKWMPPVGVAALLWVFIYAGVLFTSAPGITDPVVLQGQQLFASQCSGCHGAGGEGGTGRPLKGQILLTFPNIQDHINWVTHGSPAKGTPYGNPDRPGGQHISQDNWGAMPAFGDSGTLTADQIIAVVRYEREVLNDAVADDDTKQLAEGSGGSTGDTSADQSTGGSEKAGGSTGSSGDTAAASGGDNATNQSQTQGGKTDSQTSSTTTTTTR